ncbi:CIC_collapsed_G0048860.mRNA.1.CDS.1 [Saccharomyces cerevisiae]|nr:CIC_collapsed_G0048860.mRNA.1.CDS.1 [Saccharomyces cerevisiae]
MFNDTFGTTLTGVNDTADYLLTTKGIAWDTDSHRYGKTEYNASDIVPPPNWAKLFPNGYTDDNIPDLQNWEQFKIWMRTAALPNFYKLAMKNETNGLGKGIYIADIELNYPVRSFYGTKSFVLTTNSIIGAGNEALGIVYLIVAGIATLFAILFLIKVIFKPRPMHDHSYLNFENSDTPFDESSVVSIPLREIL